MTGAEPSPARDGERARDTVRRTVEAGDRGRRYVLLSPRQELPRP